MWFDAECGHDVELDGELGVFQETKGDKGDTGVGVASARVIDGYLILTYTDGTESDPLYVRGTQGERGKINPGSSATSIGLSSLSFRPVGAILRSLVELVQPINQKSHMWHTPHKGRMAILSAEQIMAALWLMLQLFPLQITRLLLGTSAELMAAHLILGTFLEPSIRTSFGGN